MTAAQIAAMMDMTEVEVAATAYIEAAQGDVDQALHWAVSDLLAMEAKLSEALRAVSRGYVRGELPAAAA
ncbi:hypothetical protein ASG40_19470 [Methylobacterium sp. Leaf399]|uniref:hypothetical protein n=1 Tax=Methylobacterium sp. Leaf399 TaxID=1736364 RepID=UPI0006F1E69F|nr:hypothetical protein [Methylobacterium sp. Leaf399]KQT14008.1 hypothetical protein ASG40_19470 [Methylobacterium sp. Leaf399]